MKSKFPRLLTFVSAAVLSAGVLTSGCQSQKNSPALIKGTSASSSVQGAADTIVAAREQIDVALAALRNLTGNPADIPAQYQVVQQQLEALAKSSDKIEAAADAMRAKGDAYIADWARQIAAIGDAELRDVAFGRRAEVASKLQEIFKSYQRVKADFVPFEKNLADIQRSLGSDLSQKGLEVVKPYVEKAAAAAEPLKASLDKLADEFRAVGLSLQPGGTL
jgi:Protein of unknown function (DUF2959).